MFGLIVPHKWSSIHFDRALPVIVGLLFFFFFFFFFFQKREAAAYVSAYPPAPSSYRATIFPNDSAASSSSGSSLRGAAEKPIAPLQNLGVSSRSAISLRNVLMSSLMTVRARCEEVSRGLADLSKALASGSGDDLHRQFLECFPELVGAIFGLNVPTSSASSSSSSSSVSSFASSVASSLGAQSTTASWIQQASSVEDFEAVYQLLHGKGSLFSLLIQISGLQQAPQYAFPLAALPADAFQVLQTCGIQLPGLGGGGGVGGVGGNFGSVGGSGGLPTGIGGTGGFLGSFLAPRVNRNGQQGLMLSMLEFYLAAFAWAATVLSDASSFSSSSSSGSASKIANIMRGNSMGGPSEEMMALLTRPDKNMINVLYTSLVRQYALVLLENEARSDAVSGSSLARGLSRDAVKSEAFFSGFVTITTLFWMHQNPSQFFYATSAAVNSPNASKGGLFVFQSRFVAPTYLMLNAVFDLVTLLLHATPEAPVTPSPFSSQFQFQQQQPSAHYHGASAVAYAAGRIASVAFRDLVVDSLYRMLKLNLIFAPSSWPQTAMIWRLIAAPWRQVPSIEAYAALAREHERHQQFLQENERRSSYGTGAPPPTQPTEPIPFSTLILSPFDAASLRSPFVVPVIKKAPGSAAGVVSSLASSSVVSSIFNFGAIFGGDSSSSSGSNSSGSGIRRGVSGSGNLSAPVPLKAPQNWLWYTFHDPSVSLGCLYSSEMRAAQPEVSPSEVRTFVVNNFPLYSPLLQHLD